MIVIEHGEWQGEPIRDLLTADGWRADGDPPRPHHARPRDDGHPAVSRAGLLGLRG